MQGRCACKKIVYTVANPLTCGHCHCDSCRRWQGAAFATWVSCGSESLSVHDDAKLLRSFESSPGVLRQFCSDCGTPLFFRSAGEDIVYATYATLDDPKDVKPTRHVSFEEHVAWFPFEDGLPKTVGK